MQTSPPPTNASGDTARPGDGLIEARLFSMASRRGRAWQIAMVMLLLVWAMTVTGLVLVAVWSNPVQRAVLLMAWGLIFFWIVVGGLIMRRWRQVWICWWAGVQQPWMFKFVVGCIVLASLEELITTTMTNCAPLFGVEVGQAYITASTDFFDVVLYHSVVVFVPLFIGWALLLRIWAFPPFAVFLLFGITGTLCETISFGPQNLGNAGMWILVYGLMVWLPAQTVPADRGARPPRWWAYLLAIFLPFLFLPTLFVLAPWIWLTRDHPNIHFPPIG